MANLKTSLGRCKSKARRLSRWVGIEQKKLDSKPKDRAQGAKAHRDQVVGGRKFHVWKKGCHQKCHCGLDGMVCKPLWAGQSEDLVRCELQLCHCESLNAFQSKFADWQTFSVFTQPNYAHLTLTIGKLKGFPIPKEDMHCCYHIAVMNGF